MFKIIITIIAIYFLLRFIGRLFLVSVFAKAPREPESRKRTGEVTIVAKPGKEKVIGKDEGEYTGFEEIK